MTAYLAQFQALLNQMIAADTALHISNNGYEAASAYAALRTATTEAYALAQMTGLDASDKRGLYALALDLNAEHGQAWRACNARPADVTKDGYWRVFRQCVWVAYAKTSRALFGDTGLTFANLL